MGSASSKAARASAAAAKSGKKPSWSGARAPVYDPKTSPSLRARVPVYDPTTSPSPRARQPWASESKDEEIERDAKDPQLLANLNRLGPVQVHHHWQPAETQDHVFRELFESRDRAEDEAAGARMPRNRLHVSSLVALLEERQEIGVFGGGGRSVDMRQLAEKYGMDVERVERLVRLVNVPSVGEGDIGVGAAGSMRYVRDENGEDIPVREVEWKELKSPITGRVGSSTSA